MKKTSIQSLIFILLLGLLPTSSQAARLKDLASLQGARTNQLVGYGLVVGLDGTGDGSKSAFTTQALSNMLKNMGMQVNTSDLKVKNVAGVMVTAKLPAFVKKGQNIDITLSSLGDASSLQGGTLITTPLKGMNGKVYAIGSGPVSIGGFEVRGGQTDGLQENHMTVARIPNGATVEREVPVSFADKDSITLSLNQPDFTTVSRMLRVINSYLNGPYASAKDGATVRIRIPEEYKGRNIAFISGIETLQVTPDSMAKVVMDERTGTIVMGENVRIKELALAHGNLSIQVAAGDTPLITKDMVGQTLTDEMVRKLRNRLKYPPNANQKDQLMDMSPGVSLGDLVRALNSVGVTPRDLISIFQTIKASGALQAELEII